MKAATTHSTNCEKEFVLKSIKSGIRLDGRQSYDYRNIEIEFGLDYGCCEVKLGDTKVLAQTSAEMVKPVDTRPTEGQFFLNVELSPMASPAFENGRSTNQGVEINRLVERCLKESRPVDVESLCIVAGEKVWSVRVDIMVMNDGGNILDCSCVAAICSLAHFRRPDVTVTGNEVVIHSFEEKEPLPLNVHHMPICTTFGFIDQGEQVIIDPEEKEESIISGQMTLAFNIHGEMCCAQMSGGVALEYEQILQCAKIASIKAIEITELIKEGLEADRIRRAPPPTVRREGLKDPVKPTAPTIMKTVAQPSDMDIESVFKEMRVEQVAVVPTENVPIDRLGCETVGIGNGGETTWVISDNSDEENIQPRHHEILKRPQPKKRVVIGIEDDSEEEDTIVMLSDELEPVTRNKEGDVYKQSDNQATINKDSITSESRNMKKKKKKKAKNKRDLS